MGIETYEVVLKSGAKQTVVAPNLIENITQGMDGKRFDEGLTVSLTDENNEMYYFVRFAEIASIQRLRGQLVK